MQERTVSYSKSEQVHIVQPAELNAGNRLFGGNLLKMIDELAAIVAMRHAGTKTVTTAINSKSCKVFICSFPIFLLLRFFLFFIARDF